LRPIGGGSIEKQKPFWEAHMRASRLPGTSAACVIAALVIALSAATPVAAQKRGGTLRLYHNDNPPSTSLLEESTIASVTPFSAVFNNLVVFDPAKVHESIETVAPDLAESWSWDATNTRLTFKLRQGVKWHDGKPFTAKDVQCTWRMLIGKSEVSEFHRNPRRVWYSKLQDVTINGDYEATFELTEPQPSLQVLLGVLLVLQVLLEGWRWHLFPLYAVTIMAAAGLAPALLASNALRLCFTAAGLGAAGASIGAALIFQHLTSDKLPRLEVVWADGKYHNHQLNEWLAGFQPRWRLEIVSRPPGTKGFTLLPKRWVAERTFAWNGRCRRHSKDYERRMDSSESMIRVTAVSLMLKRLAPPAHRIEFHYQTAA